MTGQQRRPSCGLWGHRKVADAGGPQEILLRHHENRTSGEHSSMQYTSTNGISWTRARAPSSGTRRGAADDDDCDEWVVFVVVVVLV